jgi:hypothetical protein
MKLEGCRIVGNPSINLSSKELRFAVIVKQGGYDTVGAEFISRAKDNGDELDIEVTGLQAIPESQKQDERSKKRSTLAYLQDQYAESIGADKGYVVDKLYQKYKIKSRTELTDAQLDYEIESYKTALQNNAA